jgi:hypothetical protein
VNYTQKIEKNKEKRKNYHSFLFAARHFHRAISRQRNNARNSLLDRPEPFPPCGSPTDRVGCNEKIICKKIMNGNGTKSRKQMSFLQNERRGEIERKIFWARMSCEIARKRSSATLRTISQGRRRPGYFSPIGVDVHFARGSD